MVMSGSATWRISGFISANRKQHFEQSVDLYSCSYPNKNNKNNKITNTLDDLIMRCVCARYV